MIKDGIIVMEDSLELIWQLLRFGHGFKEFEEEGGNNKGDVNKANEHVAS